MRPFLLAGVAGVSRRHNAAGGPSTDPAYTSAGTGANAIGNPTPAYPTNSAGDLFVMIAAVQSGTLSTPSGWTLIGSKANGVITVYAWYRNTRATGSDSGTVTITQVGGPGLAVSQIGGFSGVALTSFVESVVTTSSGSGSCPGPTIVPGGVHRLAVAVMQSNSGSAGMGPITGMSGGTWSEAAPEQTSGLGQGVVCDVAPLTSGSTISGGSAAVNGSNAGCVGFALVGA